MQVSSATVPKISVIIRKAYGAGLYAMCGPVFEPDAVICTTNAQIAVMGPETAETRCILIKSKTLSIQKKRLRFVKEKIDEYKQEIDVYKLVSEMVADEMVGAKSITQNISK